MDTAAFRDIAQVVPAVALAAAGQVAAAALGQCARLLDEHGSSATLLTRHAARNAAHYTGSLSEQVAGTAHVYASRAAYQAQRQAERVHTITSALASVVEVTVRTAASTAQHAAHRQASRAATFADDQAIAANYAMQSLVGRLPGFVPHGSSSSSSSDAFDPWADIPPRNAAEPTAAAAPAVAVPAEVNSSSMVAPTPSVPNMQDNCHAQQQQQQQHCFPVVPAAAANAGETAAQLQAELVNTQEVLADTVAALEDAHTQLAVKQLTADIFRAVERKATSEQLQELYTALMQSSADLAAARQQLEAATSTVAALPQQMVCMVQNQMRRAMREGMVELMREALASPEPLMPAASVSAGNSESYALGACSQSCMFSSPEAAAPAYRSSSTATAAAEADAADEAACTAADHAAAVHHLEQGSSLWAAQAVANMAAAGTDGSTNLLAAEGPQSSDSDGFVIINPATDSN